MPKITVFEAPDSIGFRPTEVGISATAAAARRVGTEFSDIAASQVATGRALGSGIEALGTAAVKIADHEQISRGTAAFSSFINAKTKQWDETVKTADPNDPTVGPKFLDGLEKELENFKGGFLTENAQQWAEAQTARFRTHMTEKTSADMAIMSGQAAVINTRQTVNALSNTVRGDPKSLDYSLSTLENMTDAFIASSPNLTGTMAGKIRGEILQKGREEIIKSAAMGHIEKTGDVPDWVTDPKYSGFINGTELKQFAQAARYYSRLGETENRARRAEFEHNMKLDFNAKVNDLEASMMPKNIGERATLPDGFWDKLRELGKHPGAQLDPSRIKTVFTQAETITERLNKPEPLARVSHDMTMRIMELMRRPDSARTDVSNEIFAAYQKGELNNSDFTFLNKELEARRTPEGLALQQDRTTFWKRYGSVVDPSFGATPLGQQQLYFAEMDARRQEEALKAKGLDPHLVYDPRSEYFFGNPKNIARYQKPLDELMREQRAGQTAQPVATPKAGDRKQFKQGWGVWDGSKWIPEAK